MRIEAICVSACYVGRITGLICGTNDGGDSKRMKWKGEVWVFDDIISSEAQQHVKKMMLGSGVSGSDFPWHFIPDVTGGGSKDKRPGFGQTFIRDGVIKAHEAYIKMLEPLWTNCMEKIGQKTNAEGKYSIVKSRTFLQLPLNGLGGGEYDAHHIDLLEEHLALLYYVCDADGDTVLFENMYSRKTPKPPEVHELKEKMRVKPKQGRVVIFDGYHWHTATQPATSVRCVINTDVVQYA